MKKLLLALLLCAFPALAQDITNHSMPVGGGPGAVGWKEAGPCAASQALVWAGGVGVDPSCTTVVTGVLPTPQATFDTLCSTNNTTFYRSAGVWTCLTGTSGGIPYFNSATTFTSSGTLTASAIVLGGGAGASPTSMTGTSGGVPYFNSGTTVTSSGALTANVPVIGGGAGVAPSSGTRSGNTTAFVTTTGTQTSGNCVNIDANGNHIASGGPCAGVTPDVQVFTTPGANTWTRATGVTVVRVIVCGAGGGGGGGARVAANTAASGGAGGGGGYCAEATYKAADAGASQTVTVASGGPGGTGATVNGNPGNTGSNAGNTTFGTLLTGFGGGAGQGGLASTAGSGGGGGGGPNVAGALGVNTSVAFATPTSQLAPFYTTSNTTFAFPCMGTIGTVAQLVTAAVPPSLACPNGGGGGGGSNALASPAGGFPGQDANFHGPGGGGGGGINNTNNFANAGAGGRSIGCPVGGAAGATSNGGSTAPDFNYHPGCGGGGGAGAGTFNGGNGTSGGGGGGGGVGSAVNGGTGGTGGNGFGLVISW